MAGVKPLEGVRVLDLSRLLPGPFATLCLQGLGATVVKVEEPASGDYLRHMPPFLSHEGVEASAWFTAVNRGKRSVALDLKQPGGRDALLALLADADVLVESFRPGVMARLGLDPLALRARFPRLVIASLTGWGQTGPYAQLPGHDLGFVAIAGLLAGPDPQLPRVQWADLAGGGLHAALCIAGALVGRARTGQGDWLDVAMLDGIVGIEQLAFAIEAGGLPPLDVLTGGLPNYNLYRCADGWLAVGALEPQFAAILTAVTGADDRARLAERFLGGTRAEWAEKLAAACVVPVLELAEVRADPQVRARALFTADGFAHPPTGPVAGPVPALGEHTEAELARVGYRRA